MSINSVVYCHPAGLNTGTHNGTWLMWFLSAEHPIKHLTNICMQLLFGLRWLAVFAITASRKIQAFIAARLKPKEAAGRTFRTTTCPSRHKIRAAPRTTQRFPRFAEPHLSFLFFYSLSQTQNLYVYLYVYFFIYTPMTKHTWWNRRGEKPLACSLDISIIKE